MAFAITRKKGGLLCVDGSTKLFFSAPIILLHIAAIYPNTPAGSVEISQGDQRLLITLSNLASINGVEKVDPDPDAEPDPIVGTTIQEVFDMLIATPSGNISVQTAATGTNYTAFGSQVCSSLTIFNGTGTAISVRQGGTGAAVSLPAGTSFTFEGLTNADQLQVKRTDETNTQVTVSGRYLA